MESIVDDNEALDVDRNDSDEVLFELLAVAVDDVVHDEVVVIDVTLLEASAVVDVGNMVMLVHVDSFVDVVSCRPSMLHCCQGGLESCGRCFIMRYGILVAKAVSVKDER